MKTASLFSRIVLPLASASVLLVPAVHADVPMDQIGTPANYASLTSLAGFGVNQIFAPASATFSCAVIDDFTVAGAANVTSVEVVLEAFNGFGAFSSVTGWRVSLYGSVGAAATSLVGDVASVLLNPGDVSVSSITTGANTPSALISAPVNLSLPAAGTYYVGLIPVLDVAAGGQTFLVGSGTFAGTPGGNNAVIVNPGGGWTMTDNRIQLGDDAALRVTTAVPEATTYGAIAAALGAVAWSVRRARRASN